jgi:hypothetical protein
MNCTRIEELLPLYAGADLALAEAELVRAHLTVCANCRASAQAFAGSQAWYQAAPLPEFDEDFLAGIRAAVHEEIVELNDKPNLWERLALGWRPLAAASCMLLILLGWVLYSQSSKPSQRLAGGSDKPLEAVSPTPDSTVMAQMDNTHQPTERREQRAAQDKRRPPAVRPLGASLQQDIAVTLTAGTTTEPQLSELAARAAPVEMMRMEIQTADPNIRIIWLTPTSLSATATQTESPTR